MAGNFSSLGLAGGAIKSIQRGVSASTTVTISAVNTAKSELRFLAGTGGAITLTNSTTITASGAGTWGWEITERY